MTDRARTARFRSRRIPLCIRCLGALALVTLLVPARLSAQELKINLLRTAALSDVRYYIAEKGRVPPGYILLGGVTHKDSVDVFLRPGLLPSTFDLRRDVVEYDEGTGLMFRFRVPGDYYFSRKEERRDLFYYAAPRDLTIPNLEIDVQPIDTLAHEIETASSRAAWVEDVRYNLSRERVEKAGKGLLSLDIPIALPKPLERLIGKGEETNLTVQGSERIAISGKSEWCSNCPQTEGMVRQDKFPDLNMQQNLNVSLHGNIGEKVNVEIQHSSAGGGVQSTNRVRINYRGFDDDVIKLIEMGDTDLSLSGASLVSYSGTAKGLFGVKAQAAAGPLDMTVIASKEEGETASGSFTMSGGQMESNKINDYDFLDRQFFFFENPGNDFTNPRPGFPASASPVFPVVGGANQDEIEVFVTLTPQEYGDATVFKYRAKGYVDSQNNGLQDDLGEAPFKTVVKQLFEQRDYVLIQDYSSTSTDRRYIGIELPSALDETRALLVRYRARNAVTQETFVVGDYQRIPTSDADSLVAEIICLPKSVSTGVRETDPTWNLMMRNVYSLGTNQIDPATLRVSIQDVEARNQNNPDINPASGLHYLRIFGLDRVVNNTGLPGKDDLIDESPGLVDYERGYLMFPWYEPFNLPSQVVSAFLTDKTDKREVDFKYDSLSLVPKLYTEALTPTLKTDNHKYVINVESSNGQRVFQLNAYDIIEGSEVVTVDGSKLARGTDYDIDYSTGTVSLKTSILPDSKVNIDYQHKPLVGGGKNSLLGFGANLNLSQNSRINGTFLYSSQGASKYAPRLGEEPARTMAADLNGAFIFYPSWMTSMINLLPRVDTNNQSSLNLGGEIAVSFPNPNVKGEALVDDMEGIEEADQVSALRTNWSEASPAISVDTNGAEHEYEPVDEPTFFWYNAARTGKQEYFINSRRDLNPALDERENSTLTTMFLDAVNVQPGQWCGIMTGFPGGGLDLSTAQYLEIWVNDFNTNFDPEKNPLDSLRGGTVHIDFGRIDEDFYQPKLDNFDDEDTLRTGWNIYEDTGFHGETCQYPADLLNDANWSQAEMAYRGIDCRKGNSRHDSEDLNGSGYLDVTNAYYTVSFNLADSADIDIQRDFPKSKYPDYWNDPDKKLNPRKAWRKYRIDLSKMRTVRAEPRRDAIQHMRIWVEGLDSLQVFGEKDNPAARLIEFGEIQFVGNRWEYNGIRDLAGALHPATKAAGQRLIVGSINNKDDPSIYTPPYSVMQEQGIQNKEGSLQLSYENFGPRTAFRIVKKYPQGQNYQQYQDIQFFVRQRPFYAVEDSLDFYLQIAYDSANYYEVEVPLNSITAERWIAVSLDLADLTNLKIGGATSASDRIVDKVDPTRSYRATLLGNPSLFNVRYLYAGLRNRKSGVIYRGEVWFDDVRLGGVRRDIDHAESVRAAADFGGVLQVNTSYTRTGPEFRSLRATRGSGVSNSNLNITGKTDVESFVPTARFNLPVNVQYSSTEALPKYLLNSDVDIADPAVRDSLKSVSKSLGFSVSESRRGSTNPFARTLFDNLKTNFSYSKRSNVSPTRRDTTWTMSGSLNYQISFRKGRQLGLYRGVKWRYWLSSFTYETGVSRQTKEQYVLSSTNDTIVAHGDTTIVKPLVRQPFFYAASWNNAVSTLYEPFESVKMNFSLSEQRDLGYDHNFHDIPIGIETGFNHNFSLNYQPGTGIPILSEFNPRFDFKSRYAEDLNPSNRQVRRSFHPIESIACDTAGCDTTWSPERVNVFDPFGTRDINNERQMTFAFMLDAGKYVMRLGSLLHLVEKGEGPPAARRAQSFAGSSSGASIAMEKMREVQEEQKRQQQQQQNENAGKVVQPEGEENLPPGGGAGAPTTPPAGGAAGGLGDLGLKRGRGEIAGAAADTSAAAARDTGAAARADTARGRKIDPYMPVKKLIRFLGSVEPVNANVNVTHRSSYDRIYDRADIWYQLGLSDDTGVPGAADTVRESVPVRASNVMSIDLRSSVGITQNIGLEVKGRFDIGRDEFNGKRTDNRRVTWPTLTLNWKGMERYALLNRYMKQSNLVFGYERRTSETQTGTENAYALNPTWDLEWKNALSTNLSATYSKQTTKKRTQELWNKAWGVNLSLRYNIEGSKGFGIPLPILNRRKVSFKSTLTTTLNLGYNRFSTQIDPSSSVLSVSPSVQYRFSNNVTGGAGVDYKRSAGGRLGQIHHTVDVQVNAEFKF